MPNPFDDTPESEPPSWSTPRVRPRDPRSGTAYKALHAEFVNHHRLHRNPDGSIGSPCVLCSRPINYRLRYPHPQSPSLHHDQSVRDHPELLLSWANFRITHLVCNQRHDGETDNDADLDLGEPSETW
jgi:hypothetical protein